MEKYKSRKSFRFDLISFGFCTGVKYEVLKREVFYCILHVYSGIFPCIYALEYI